MTKGSFTRLAIAAVAALLALPATAARSAPQAQPGAGENYLALDQPQRLLDTRPGGFTADAAFAGIGRRPGGSVLDLPVAGRVGIPADASAAVLNLTADAAGAQGFVTVYPCNAAVPVASNLNYSTGETIANLVVAPLDDRGHVCLYNEGDTHLLLDAAGYLEQGSVDAFQTPARLLDTRPGTATVDGLFIGGGPAPPGTTIELLVAGRDGIPTDATTVVLNVTADAALEPGFITVHPCGQPRPNASALNYSQGGTSAVATFTGIGAGGRVCIYNSGATHVLADATAVVQAAAYAPLAVPSRLVDTRVGAATVDGAHAGLGVQPSGGTFQLDVAGRGGVPSDASSVVLTLTVDNAVEDGYLTVHPTGSHLPIASNLNYGAGETIANSAVARLGPAGEVCVFTAGTTDVIVDVVGSFHGPPPAGALGCPATPPISVAEQFVTQLNLGQWSAAATTSGLSAAEIQAQWPTTTGPSSNDPAHLLETYCLYGGGLCAAPTSITSTNDGVTVSYSPEQESVTWPVDANGTPDFTLPPFSVDQRRSRCEVFDLESNTPYTRTAEVSPTEVPGVVWSGITPFGDAHMAWAPASSDGFWGPYDTIDTVSAAGLTWELARIEDGVQANALLDGPDGCGRYTVWTYATLQNPLAMERFLQNLVRS